MSQPEIERLIDQLYENNPRVQKNAIRQMVRLADPKAIPELVSLYKKEDADPGVKRAAADALRAYKRMEGRIIGGETAQRSSPISPDLLEKVRTGLIVLLVITLLGNGLLFAKNLIPPPATPEPTVATPRDTLTTALKARIDGTHSDAAFLRARWQEVQGGVKLTCPGKYAGVQQANMSAIDLRTYPDLKALNDTINQASQQVADARKNWDGVCGSPTDKDNVARYAGSGGAVGRIKEIDDTMKVVDAAQIAFDQWVNYPAPTQGPTATPITPTPAPPTITPTKPTATPGPSATLTLTPPPVTLTPTPPQSLTFDGLRVFSLTVPSYAYKLVVKYDGKKTGANGGTYKGTLTVQVSRPTKPLTAQGPALFDISLSEDNKVLAVLNPTYYVPGRVRYTLIGGALYVDNAKTCTANRTPDAAIASLEAFKPDAFFNFSGLALNRKLPDEQINGVVAQHYTAESKTGDGKTTAALTSTYDVYVTADKQVPVRITYSVNGPPSIGLQIPAASQLTGYSLSYDLTPNADLNPIKAPTGCK